MVLRRPSTLLVCTALLGGAALLAGCDRDDPATPVVQAPPAPTAPADTLPSAPGAGPLGPDSPGAGALLPTGPVHLPPAGLIGWAWPRSAQDLDPVKLPGGVTLVGLDGPSTRPAQVAALKARGLYTVCRLNLTPASFPNGEARAALFTRRLGDCVIRGFDAVDPGDLGAAGQTEAPRARQQRLDFAGWLADQAHAAGLAIFQHGALGDVNGRDQHGRVLADIFDGVLSGDCRAEKGCGALSAYVHRGKLALDLAAPGTGLDCLSAERLGINRLSFDRLDTGSGSAAPAAPGCD